MAALATVQAQLAALGFNAVQGASACPPFLDTHAGACWHSTLSPKPFSHCILTRTPSQAVGSHGIREDAGILRARCAHEHSNSLAGSAAQPPGSATDGGDDGASEPCRTPQPEQRPAAVAKRHVLARPPGHAAKPPLSPMIAASRPQLLKRSNLGEGSITLS